MQTFKQSFNAEQSGAHPKGVQVTQIGRYWLLSSLLPSFAGFPQPVYVDPRCNSRKR